MFQSAYVTDDGLNEIAEALGQFHKLGRDHFTKDMLCDWAREAEENFTDNGRCWFEIKSAESIDGRPHVVDISGFEIDYHFTLKGRILDIRGFGKWALPEDYLEIEITKDHLPQEDFCTDEFVDAVNAAVLQAWATGGKTQHVNAR